MGFPPDNLAHAPHGGPTESYKAFNLSHSAKYSLRLLQGHNSTLSPRMATFKYGLSLQYILIGIGSGSCCSSESGQAPAAAWSPADLRSPLSSSTRAGGDDSSSLPNGSLGVVRFDEGIEVYVPLPLCSIALLFCINSGAQWRIQLDSGPILLPFCLAHFGQCAASQNSIQVIQMIRRGGGHDDR